MIVLTPQPGLTMHPAAALGSPKFPEQVIDFIRTGASDHGCRTEVTEFTR
jgi:hypothetical protein